ncbi:dihydrouridine synthase 2 isoform X2 [Lycorma delicatula]|uniref:dihydrouridine synthase 2 isoform X2 n=1 Tax=Lycorma delicatula TaxID=130591 RepID=UPI003F50EBBF
MKLNYINKKILAPMVRIGTLPMRLLCLDYGCDIVYSEELIDWKIVRSERRINDILGTVDFVDKSDGAIVFRTCSREKAKVVLQMGTSDPQRALEAAKLVQSDVAAVDVNMGCPKEFSVKGGMGAALLCNPDKAEAIMRTLVKGLDCPVTCKVRVLPDPDETVEFCQRLANTGIAAIAIHGRTKNERPQHVNHNDIIQLVAKNLSIPVIANGGSLEIENYEDMDKFKELTGCSSTMVARAAEWNCSIFRKEGKLPINDVITAYLRYCVDYDNNPSNTKYCIQNMLRDLQTTTDEGKSLLESHSLEEMCTIWGIGDYCKSKQLEFRKKGLFIRRDIVPESAADQNSDSDVTELKCAFLRSLYKNDKLLPKTHLCTWARRKGYDDPVYETTQVDKKFKSVVTLNNTKYSSSFWEKNKRWAEQAAALVCLCILGIVDSQPLKEIGALDCCRTCDPPESKRRKGNDENCIHRI